MRSQELVWTVVLAKPVRLLVRKAAGKLAVGRWALEPSESCLRRNDEYDAGILRVLWG
jgi:hypothetical protein